MLHPTAYEPCARNAPAELLPATGRAEPVAGGAGAGTPAGVAAADLIETLTLTKEYAGATTITNAVVLADLGAAALLEVDILIRQVNNQATDQIGVTFGGATVDVPLGGTVTFRALPGMKLDDFSIDVAAGEAVDISAQGVN